MAEVGLKEGCCEIKNEEPGLLKKAIGQDCFEEKIRSIVLA